MISRARGAHVTSLLCIALVRARGGVLHGFPALLVHAHGDNARHGDVRRGFRSDVNVTTADSPRTLSSPARSRTHTTMAAMTTTAHNYDDVRSQGAAHAEELRRGQRQGAAAPKNFEEVNCNCASPPLSPPHRPRPRPRHASGRAPLRRRRRRTRSGSEEEEESSSRRRRARAEECRAAPRGGRRCGSDGLTGR